MPDHFSHLHFMAHSARSVTGVTETQLTTAFVMLHGIGETG